MPVEFPKEVVTDRDNVIRRAKLLAMLHDLGHGPFGHALDNYVGYVNNLRVPSSSRQSALGSAICMIQ